MSEAIAPVPGTLEGLYQAVQRRISQAVSFGAAPPYQQLADRYQRVTQGMAGVCGSEVFAAELQELLDAPDDTLRRMVAKRAVNARCISEATVTAMRTMAEGDRMRQLRSSGLPRISPAELVQQFAARGVMVRAEGGMLHVSPPEALTQADRDALTANKADIMAVLTRPAEVI